MEVTRVLPTDLEGIAAAHAVWHRAEQDMWPERVGFSERDFRAMCGHVGGSRRFELHVARGESGTVLGTGTMEIPLLENLHSVEMMVMVDPNGRRRGVGTALVEHIASRARADGRRVLNSIVDVPVAVAQTHPSGPFARHLGFAATMAGNTRILRLPMDVTRMVELREAVATARGADHYRTLTFTAPWPGEYVEDHCELRRRMSTDEPAGDGEREEEHWDAQRLADADRLFADRGATVLVGAAEHVPSGRVVAMSEILLAEDTRRQAWQMITVVHPEHRGHRLGLAVKVANLTALMEVSPTVEFMITGNAAVNTPMIAVNDMMGFEIDGIGNFWQRTLD